jgi:large subunit ribosomal protein L19
MGIILDSINQQQLKQDVPEIFPGDTIRVSAKVVEGSRERLQAFEGTVIRLSSSGPARSVTVRRIAHGIGVERTYLIHSPRVDKIEVIRRGAVRRARLYYLRDRVGKATRIRERRGRALPSAAPKAQPVVAEPEVVEETPAIETAAVAEELTPTAEAPADAAAPDSATEEAPATDE